MLHHLLKFKMIWILLLVIAIAASIPVGQTQAAPAAQNGPKTWTVLVGGQAGVTDTAMGPVGVWQFMRFYPDKITINEGDTVVWKLASAEPHTVTFPKLGEKPPELIVPEGGTSQRALMNPLAVMPQGEATYDGSALTGSGQIGGDPQMPTEYKLTFSKAGDYQYFCIFHMMMTGQVTVQAAGSAYPKTQEIIDSDAAAQLLTDTQAAEKVEPDLTKAATRSGPNGTTIHEVNMGYGDSIMSWMRFGPADLTIHAGDTVEWTQKDVETPHTVTLVSGGQEPELVLTEPQQGGPPKLVLNPEVLAPAGGTTYSGQGYFNSGLIWGTKVPQPGSRTYSLTFDTPGTYEYICVLHDMMGMNGHITVVAAAADAPKELPTTGGSFDPLSSITWLVSLGLGLVVAGMVIVRAVKERA